MAKNSVSVFAPNSVKVNLIVKIYKLFPIYRLFKKKHVSVY